MLAHPDRHKRLGAVQAWSRSYRHMREETSLVSKYALGMAWSLMLSLRRAHTDHRALGVVSVCVCVCVCVCVYLSYVHKYVPVLTHTHTTVHTHTYIHTRTPTHPHTG